VIRGGSWNNDAQNCRAANRNNNPPDNRDNNLGFRLASAGQRPDVMCLRMRRLCHALTICPGPVPVHPDKQARPAAASRPVGSKTAAGQPY
jgi:Sulfatase-modifying factor enzyme 1